MSSEKSITTLPESQPNQAINIDKLFSRLQLCLKSDQFRFKKRLMSSKKTTDFEKQQKTLKQVSAHIDESIQKKQLKIQSVPKITYPESLPVSQNADLIAKTIMENQVVIIAGETGSGKTTQIPKICLALGRGIDGMIGHTQPRRIAARTVATRIADELSTKLGDAVGYKVRFNDLVSDKSYIKLMTDGILLAEMQHDRLLRKYDTLIIDEAHERSLNIDFLLGYLREILPKRPDLKIIITSATIDPERFSQHFASALGKPAPIIEVSGRTFPVEILYRPLNADNNDETEEVSSNDIIRGILQAVDELGHISQGDILIFLNGEREIRDAALALERANLRYTQVLPLYSRLTVQEQNRIFKPHSGRNIVLATNVAETSLTVPGIKYVIDPGTARISRYSYRTKVQRLPIEAISQASANQRAGRCGRVSAGVCLRLYSEEDFLGRPEFTDPEILRTNLATVILQMLALDLGEISDFPFVQPPDNRNINDGVSLLEELAAIEKQPNKIVLTKAGRMLAKFPTDPRLSKMILSAIDLGCIEQIFIIVSAVSIQDPRERPHEKQQAADEKHNRFKDKESDFISLLNLWHYIEQQQKALTNNQFRNMCKKEFLAYMRIREWQDIFSQLKYTLRDLNIPMSRVEYTPPSLDANNTDVSKKTEPVESNNNNIIHQAILSGLLSHLGQLDENREYKGARNSRFFIFPGSGVAKKSPKWIMATELVETSRLFARMVAKIDLQWIEPLAEHLIKRNYSEPHWEKKQGAVMAFEQVMLYGLTIVAKRKISFNHIEPHTCREIFIREALVNGDSTLNEKFYQQNHQRVASIEKLEQKARRKDFLVDEERLVEFYDEKLPETIICQRSFLSWWKKSKQKNAQLLNFTEAFLLNETAKVLSASDYPDVWHQGNLTLPLSYHFTPGEIDDGISLHIPVGILNQIKNRDFDWLIPALRLELIIALIRGLPKPLRRNFVPAPNYAEACLSAISEEDGKLVVAIEKHLLRMTGVRLPENIWQDVELPIHLTMNFKVIDEKGVLINQSRNFEQLQASLQGKVKASIKKVADKGIEREQITSWDFNNIPKGYEKNIANITIKAFPALVDKNKTVAIELFEQESLAEQAMVNGVSRLILLNIPSPVKYLQQNLPNKAKLSLYFNPFGSIPDLLDDCILAACQHLVKEHGDVPRNQNDFEKAKEHVRAELADCVLVSALKVEKVLTLTHDIGKKLKGRISLEVIQAQADIKEQLGLLVFKGFVTASGHQRLEDIARYLQAMLRRMEKLPVDPNQDRLKMLEVAKVNDAYLALLAKQSKSKPIVDGVLAVRWMIEEFRVSIFAQNLKTAYPVSAKRILNHLKEISAD